MPRMPPIMLVLFLANAFCAPAGAQSAPRLRVVTGVSSDGLASGQWLAMLLKRLADSTYQAVAGLRRPLSRPEWRWASLIRSRAAVWETEIPQLAVAYAPVHSPEAAIVVLGNRGGEDAFTHDRTTIGFDLSALERYYGSAELPENTERIDRFFRHEYAHLLQKAWLETHPPRRNSPLERALLDIWSEGLGNYYSLSSRWRGEHGIPTAHAMRTLAVLEPRFVARLAALACAARAEISLTADLSAGPFAEKWGALPAALWLAKEEADSVAALRRFVLAGPQGVWALAERGIAPELRPVLREVRDAASRCDGPD